MEYCIWLWDQCVVVVRDNRLWMTWNLMLAAVPAVLGYLLFRRPSRRGPLWWVGAVAFGLSLPNAPYVITDLIHLRSDVAAAPTDSVVIAAVLPLYAVFVAAGFVAYAIALAELLTFLRPRLPGLPRRWLLIGLHLISATGVVLGRIARLNSWDAFVAPVSTFETVVATLAWKGAPVAVLLVFLTIWAGHAITCQLARPLLDWRPRRL